MYYYIYKITNNINGKYYIGAHKSYIMEDSYMGSGKLIQSAVKKYGKDNFTKEVLFNFQSESEMYAKEAEIVNQQFCQLEETYNMAPGGTGGTMTFNQKPHCAKHSESAKEKIRQAALRRKPINDETRKKISENNFSKKDPDKQREHARLAGTKRQQSKLFQSEETKQKIRDSIIKWHKERKLAGLV